MHTLLARILLLVAGVLIGVGGVAGVIFLIQNDTSTSPRDQTKTVPGGGPLPSTATGSDTNEPRSNIAVPSKVDQLVFPERTFERKATIVSWIATLSDDEILSWLEQSTEPSWRVAPANRTELQTTLLQKLSTTAPDRAIEFALAREEQQQLYSMGNTVFQVWVNTDIDGAVARVKELNEQESYNFVGTVLTARDDLSLERMQEIAIELGDERTAFSYYFHNLTRGEIENPRDIWYEIINIANSESVQDTTGLALSNVAAAWVEEKGLDVLDELMSSLSHAPEYSSILHMIFNGISVGQPEKIFDYVMSNLGDQATDIIQNSNIIYGWAQTDPKGMLAKADTLPASSFRRGIVRTAVWRWAENHPRQLLEQLELIPAGHRDDGSLRAIRKLTESSPTEAAEIVMQVTDDDLQMHLARSFIPQWVKVDAEAAKEWVLSLPVAKPMRASLVDALTMSIAQRDPRGAFELARQQPFEEEEFPDGYVSIAPEVSILNSISHQDFDLALELLPQVRTEGKVSACTTLGVTFIRQGNTDQALELVEQIPEEDQAEYYQVIARSWPQDDPKGLLNAFEDFPTTVKSKAALSMIMSNEESKSYSDEEIASLENHISTDDKKLLERLKKIDMNNPTPEDMQKLREVYVW